MRKVILIVFLLMSAGVSASTSTNPQVVYVGLHLNDVINVDLKTNTFNTDFYLWFRWKGELDPSESFEFVNPFETWSHSVEKNYETPKKIKGWKYQSFHVNGNFHNPFILKDYPLDKQNIVIEIEDTRHTHGEMTYLADTSNSSFRESIVIPGWTLKNQRVQAFNYRYPTNFGDTESDGKEIYSRFKYALAIERPKALYLFRMLLPIAVVLLCTLIIFFIDPKYADSRLAVAITSLVSAVALHLTVASDLPSVGYLVLIDKIYNLSYLAIFVALAETVVTIYLKDQGKLSFARRLDRFALLSVGGLFVLTCGAMIWFV